MGSSNPSKHPKPTTFTSTLSHHPTPNPDLTQPSKPSFMLKHLQSLNTSYKTRAPHKLSQTNHPSQLLPPPPLVDTHLQPNTMTSSAIFASNFSLPTPTPHNTIVEPKLDRERKQAKRPSKVKPQKCNMEMERWKLEGVMKDENEDSDKGVVHSRVLFEDVKVENSIMLDHDVVKGKSVSLAPSGGRRRSFCGSKVDLGDVFAVNGVKVVSADMPPFMQIHAVDYARKAFDSMEKFTSKTLAFTLKKEFDGVYGPAWHCIVGTNFGSFVTHAVGGFLYFSMDQKLYILLFKTPVQKAG